MRPAALPRLRTRNLLLDGSSATTPEEIVSWLGAVQAQEPVPAKWSLAQRGKELTLADVDRALAEGTVIRTHALRPTWHFLARRDARDVLALTGPRIRRGLAHRHRELGLDAKTVARIERVVLKALTGGNHMTRAELGEVLTKNGLDMTGQRLPHALSHCELVLAICSGAPRERAHTYAVFDERVPVAKEKTLEAATRALVEAYLRSHGPASVTDMQWWASLTAASIRAALEDLGDRVATATVAGVELWWVGDGPGAGARAGVRLLETYDEYIVGYTKTRFLGDPNGQRALEAWRARAAGNLVARGGLILGAWRRVKKATAVTLDVRLYEEPSESTRAGLRSEARRWQDFYGTEISLAHRP